MDKTRQEYEIQFYGFSLDQLKIEHRLKIGKIIQEYTKHLAETSINELSIEYKNDENIKKMLNKADVVSENILKSIENELSEFDNLVDKHFSIPDNVLLEEDIIHLENYTENDEEYFKEKVNELEKSIKQNIYTTSFLKSHIEEFEKLKEMIKSENELAKKVDECLNIKIDLDKIESLILHASKDKKKLELDTKNIISD